MNGQFQSVLVFIQFSLAKLVPRQSAFQISPGGLYQLATVIQPVLSDYQMAPKTILGLLRYPSNLTGAILATHPFRTDVHTIS